MAGTALWSTLKHLNNWRKILNDPVKNGGNTEKITTITNFNRNMLQIVKAGVKEKSNFRKSKLGIETKCQLMEQITCECTKTQHLSQVRHRSPSTNLKHKCPSQLLHNVLNVSHLRQQKQFNSPGEPSLSKNSLGQVTAVVVVTLKPFFSF